MRIVHALSVQLRQVCSLKLVACMAVFAGVQGLAISGLMVVTPDPSALYYYVLSTTSGTTYLTFYVLPTVPFSMSLAQEWDNHATPTGSSAAVVECIPFPNWWVGQRPVFSRWEAEVCCSC